MGIPGIAHRFMCSRAVATLSLLFLLCVGCGNPFTQFYTGSTVSELQRGGLAVQPSTTAEVVTVPMVNLEPTVRMYLEDNWVYIGYSSWVGPPGSENEAKEQARRLGASVVIWAYEYRTTTTGSIPITTPTMSTTYGGGTAYGNTGVTNWSGSATTYGTQTTVVNVPRHIYSGAAAYLTKRTAPPVLGVHPKRLTGEQQQAAGTVDGLLIDIVNRGGPAAEAGLLPGDVLTVLGGMRMNPDTWDAAIKASQGQTVEIEFIRRGEQMKRQITLNPLPDVAKPSASTSTSLK